MTLGILRNPYATNVPDSLVAASDKLQVASRIMDAETITLVVDEDGVASVRDRHGIIDVHSIAPYLLYGFPAAIHAIRRLARVSYMQNPVDGVLVADDKASTTEVLACKGVAQITTLVCALDLDQALSAAGEIGYPVVLKRAHGAQGRWVRRAADRRALEASLRELEVEGPGTLIVQPEVVECEGRSLRIVITGGNLLAATERSASAGEWRSNIAGGAGQIPTGLTQDEADLAKEATEALGLQHAGVDILRTAKGPRVLEINSCPDFTSMQPYFDQNLGEAVIRASMPII